MMSASCCCFAVAAISCVRKPSHVGNAVEVHYRSGIIHHWTRYIVDGAGRPRHLCQFSGTPSDLHAVHAISRMNRTV